MPKSPRFPFEGIGRFEACHLSRLKIYDVFYEFGLFRCSMAKNQENRLIKKKIEFLITFSPERTLGSLMKPNAKALFLSSFKKISKKFNRFLR